jgi:hypothetical protein
MSVKTNPGSLFRIRWTVKDSHRIGQVELIRERKVKSFRLDNIRVGPLPCQGLRRFDRLGEVHGEHRFCTAPSRL